MIFVHFLVTGSIDNLITDPQPMIPNPEPFVVYVDFESVLHSMNEKNKIQEHRACSYAYHIVSNIPGVEFEPRMHVVLNGADHML